ncbi:MAG TPA: hypothetical protein VEZ20_05420 [Allosphingosinicella sp.]|nr:hypothetical protein [Allosphingosinicella sp.]
MAESIFWTTALWLFLSIPCYWLLRGWQRYLTPSPRETASRLWSLGPGRFAALTRFRERTARAYEALGGHSLRVLFEHKHRKLGRELASIRQVLDRRLQQIAAASLRGGGGSLVDLLRGFKADVDRALTFGTLEDGFVDDTLRRKKAVFYTTLSVIFALVLAAANFGLLYLFFSESFEGQRIPLLGLELAFALSLLFPVLEFAAGVGGKIAEEAGAVAKYVGFAVAALALLGFGSLEYIIFYQLFDGLFEQMVGFERGGTAHALTSLVGPALTLLEAVFGYMAMKHIGEWRELRTHQTIRGQIADANRFVAGLEGRYHEIDRAASAAGHSVDELANQLSGRGEAELPVASAIAEQREALRSAIDGVNPERWPAHKPGSDSEEKSVKALSWILAVLALAGAAIFTLAAGPTIERSGIFGRDADLIGYVVALGAAAACFVAGSHLFDRTTVAYDTGSEWRAAIAPRDNAYRMAAAFTLLIAVAGTAWICIEVAGVPGIARALFLIALLVAMAMAGSYHDMIARGAGFLVRMAAAAGILAGAGIAYLLWGAATLAATLLAGFLHILLALAAWPLTWLASRVRAKTEPRRDPALLPAG